MLEFIFKDGENLIFKNKCEYKINNNILEFDCEDNNIKIQINEKDFVFCKTNKDSIFTIKKTDDDISAMIYIFEKDMEFDIKLYNLDYTHNDGYINIKYILESDEKSLKSLEIRY